MLEKEVGRSDQFEEQLQRIQYQSERVACNPNYDFNLEGAQKLMKEKSIQLLTAVVNYFNSALLYYNQTSFGSFFTVPAK